MRVFVFSVASVVLVSLCPVLAGRQSFVFRVKHDHFLGSGSGQLTISRDGITYDSKKDAKHTRKWRFTQIQELKIVSSKEIHVLTYEDVRWKLNSDREFTFELEEGEITPEVVLRLREFLPLRLVSAVFAVPDEVFYEIPAKHQHTFGGGCDGQLLFSDVGVLYTSSNSQESRFWTIEQIRSLGRMSDFRFRLTVSEHSRLGSTRNFQFQLKQPMDEAAYERLWRRVYEPASWLNKLRADTPLPWRRDEGRPRELPSNRLIDDLEDNVLNLRGKIFDSGVREEVYN